MHFPRQIIRVVAGLMTAMVIIGCSGGDARSAATAETLCVDTKTGELVIVSAATEFPAINSQTGAATLMPGMYCPKCKSWHVAPPVEQLQRQKGVAHCPKSKAVLAIDGPTPANARRQP